MNFAYESSISWTHFFIKSSIPSISPTPITLPHCPCLILSFFPQPLFHQNVQFSSCRVLTDILRDFQIKHSSKLPLTLLLLLLSHKVRQKKTNSEIARKQRNKQTTDSESKQRNKQTDPNSQFKELKLKYSNGKQTCFLII